MERDVRATYGVSSSRDVELPVEGPVTKVVHSADGHCGCSELQILAYADNTRGEPIPLPNLVAGELSNSSTRARGSGNASTASRTRAPSQPRRMSNRSAR